MPYHLPVLLNPLLNAVFNCPSPQTSSLKQLFSKLANEKFLLLVPSTEVLLHYQALDSGKDYAELCYQYDFVASHVIVVKNDGAEHDNRMGQGTEFTTLNGKKVSIRYQHKSIVTGLGFDAIRKAEICETRSLVTFNDYLKGSHCTPIIYIDRPLCGELALSKSLGTFSTEAHQKVSSKSVDESDEFVHQESFDLADIIQASPGIDKSLSLTFHLCKRKLTKCMTIGEIRSEWIKLRETVYEIVSNEKKITNLENLQKSIYDYVEKKIYDKIYDSICRLVHNDELEGMVEFRSLQYLSLNQVSTTLYSDTNAFSMKSVVRIEGFLKAAIDRFKTIGQLKTHEGKLEALRATLEDLCGSNNEHMIDADSLLGLFVLTICRSQLHQLKATFIFLNTFAYKDNYVRFGVNGYAVSTLEAVLSFLTSDTVKSLSVKCNKNKMIWSLIENRRTIKLNYLVHALQIRTVNGESIISLCIQNHHNDELIDLLLNYQNEIPLEDLLEDKDCSGSTLLIQALQAGNLDAAHILSEVFKKSCSEEELIEYVNSPNKYQRILGHYLMQDGALLDDLGKYVDWEFKDINGHTPLFAIFRSYDTPDYDILVAKALETARKWYNRNNRDFLLQHHEDERGNNLLHVLKSNIMILLSMSSINLHKLDRKGMTPLMIYARYNRLENIETIMKDSRLIWDKIQQPLAMTCLDCTKNKTTVRKIVSNIPDRTTIFLHSLKFENKRWKLLVTCNETNEFSLKSIQKLLYFLNKKYYFGFHPIEFLTSELKMLGMYGLPSILRLQTIDTFKKLSIYFSYLNDEGLLYLDKNEVELNYILDSTTEFLSESEKFVFLEPEQVNAIQVFLKFNHLEFTKLKTQITVLKKLVTVQELKVNDQTTARNLFSQLGKKLHDTTIANCFKKLDIPPNSTSSYQLLICGFQLLEACFESILNSIDTMLKKIVLWWKYYGEFMELRKEYRRSFPDNETRSIGSERRNFIDSLIDGKRSTYRKRLSGQVKAASIQLKKCGGEIKDNHELLAVNLNSFMKFKEKLYRDFLIKASSYRIKESQEQVKILEEVKNDCTNLSH